jgi:sec-independent protein translocase protein TatA
MDFFGIGFGEIVLILIVALMIFGPGKLPEIARSVGRFSRNLRKMSSDFTTAMSKEIDLEQEQKNLKKMATDLKADLTTGLSLEEEQKNLKKMATDLKTDLTTGLSLEEEPHSHLDPGKTQPRTLPSTAAPPQSNGQAGPETSPPAVKHG